MNTNSILLISNIDFIKNVKDFVSSLTIIDITFFFSVVLLMILVVTLLYFIKMNEDTKDNEEIIKENLTKDLNVNKEEVKYSDEEEGELFDLESITKALENKEPSNIDLTAFEEEQEKDAIISYDELINKSKSGAINYKSESMLDDLLVKEVDLNNIVDESAGNSEIVGKTQVISYAQEEAFLEALKKLQQQLN